MQRARGRRLVASLTTVLVAVSAVVVVLSVPASSGAEHPKPHHRPKVTATVTETAHATVRRTFRATVHQRARATASASSHGHKGQPVGHATRSATAGATVTVHARAKARATASATASARTGSRAKSHALAQRRAHHKALAKARTKAAAKARHLAALKARAAGRKKAHARAHHRAHKRALHKARHIARLRRIDPHDPTTFIRAVPRHVTPSFGPKFNNPYGSRAKRRALLTRVIRSIQSSPGYKLTRDPDTGKRLHCPSNPKYYPSEIKIAVYSIADMAFADAVKAAQRRCVSVQVLMNSHLDSTTSRSWAKIRSSLGPRSRTHWPHQRSFAHRCSNGCLGTSVLHSKIYLFSHAGRAHHTVMTGSTNMTRNAVSVQWNDLFTVNGNRQLYDQYRHMFTKMVPDRMANGPYVFTAGRYTSVFFPFRKATERSDRTMRSLGSISCHGARHGTGIHGRTIVYIAMHAWFSDRGIYLARRVRQLYDQGCYVRILYSFMSHPAFRLLKDGTGKRMVVRRVLFPGPAGLHAAKYSHMKMYAASGHIGKNHAARMVWTGSANWVRKSLHADEVTLRIESGSAYKTYVRHWKLMRNFRSSPFWAKFEEPEGGGRAP